MPRDNGNSRPPPRVRQPVDPLWRPPQMVDWLAARGVGMETIELLGLYACKAPFGLERIERPAICFPYFLAGKAVANDFVSAKGQVATEAYLDLPYNVDSLADNDTAILCMTALEAAACVQAGYPTVITSPSAAQRPGASEALAQMFPRQDPLGLVYDQLARIKRFVFAYPMTETGDYFVEQWAEKLGVQRCYRARLPAGLNVTQTVQLPEGSDRLRSAIDRAALLPIRGLVKVGGEDLVEYRKSPALASFGTGVKEVDRYLRWRPKQLAIITGNPSGGKTSWMNWIATRLAMSEGWRWVICSPEHDTKQHAGVLAEMYAGQPFRDYGAYTLGMSEDRLRQAGDFVEDKFTWIVQDDEDAMLDLNYVLEKARAERLRSNVNALFLDPWNQFQHGRRKDQTLDEYCVEALRRLKMFARNENMLVCLNAHTTKLARDRDGKRPIPSLGDINGSQAFWSMADVGITVHRRDLSIPETDIYVTKIKLRDQGREGNFRMSWDRQTGLYAPQGEEEDEEQPRQEMGV